MKIQVTYIETNSFLSTQDGTYYSVKVLDNGCSCSDMENNACSNCSGKFTEKH